MKKQIYCETTEDVVKALIEYRELVTPDDTTLFIDLSGSFRWQNTFSGGDVPLQLDSLTNSTFEVEVPWDENIPEQGVLCEVQYFDGSTCTRTITAKNGKHYITKEGRPLLSATAVTHLLKDDPRLIENQEEQQQ